MKENHIYNGDALEVLQGFPSQSIQSCVTSPPYYGLRDYGIDGQIGLEDTPEQYINRLVDVFREVRRVLKHDGTLWVNIGDSYAGSGKGAANYPDSVSGRKQESNKGSISTPLPVRTPAGCKPKDLIGIPWMLAFALRADGWYLRQDIIWAKSNPMPESVRDRCTKSHEYIFLLSKLPHYYFDIESIAEPIAQSTKKRIGENSKQTNPPRYGGNKYTANPSAFNRTKSGNAYCYKETRNKRDVWTISTKPYKEAHFATFPPELITPCILAGSREGDTILDPFFGSGTTGEVAVKHGRKFVGIEINPNYCEMSESRIEPLLAQTSLFT